MKRKNRLKIDLKFKIFTVCFNRMFLYKIYILHIISCVLMKSSAVDEGIMAIEKLILKIKPGTSTAIKSAVVALYTADQEGELRFSKFIGMMQLDIDRHLKTHMLRFYCMESLNMVFEVELYYGFYENYKMVSNNFYTFEYPRGLIGIMYRNQDDADIMKLKIKSASPPMK